MNYPYEINAFKPLELKLGIKSSLSNIKKSLSLIFFLWKSNNEIFEIAYSESFTDQEENEALKIKDEHLDSIVEYLEDYVDEVDSDILSVIINEDNIFSAQIESLIVAFELIWRVAIFEFENNDIPYNAERQKQGGKKVRYRKKIKYTRYMDHLDLLISNNNDLVKCLYKWLIEEPSEDEEAENTLVKFFTMISDDALYRLRKSETEQLIFNMSGVYQKASEEDSVQLKDYTENLGSLRILNSSIKEGLNYYIVPRGRRYAKKDEIVNEDLAKYSLRTGSLNKLFNIDRSLYADSKETVMDEEQTSNASDGLRTPLQKIYYGAPGTGKSFQVVQLIKEKEKQFEGEDINQLKNVFRTTIYPEYSYNDFIGNIMPVVKDGSITYEFEPGVFTRALKYAYDNRESNVYMIIEEMSRGNISSIFGDVFQLLDRNDEGKSEYGLNNELIANEIYCMNGENEIGDNKIYLPSNFSILGTVNTSDQNVFVMDNAFKRRFEFEYVSTEETLDNGSKINDFTFKYAGRDIKWLEFYKTLNDYIVDKAELSEDKQVGQFFIKGISKEGIYDEDANTNLIKNKLLQYLWSDVNEMIFDSESKIFKENFKSFSQIYNGFVNNEEVFNFSI
ncbi:AAA family ATPase [Salinicoccus roseus]|uniref:AAA family ATPase n=1 Tax=Salinicoccus roseus TaxID=45670 RepID=UPI001CA69BE1|nr:AAA family ATPase [Salinicoccus roseus]MBY8908260.1 AAA family ATPase [Salinicoccus roseus]